VILPDGDLTVQVELALADTHVRVPWEGQSPRALTRGYERFILKAQAKESMSEFGRNEDQFDLWATMEERPWVYSGAPLLVG